MRPLLATLLLGAQAASADKPVPADCLDVSCTVTLVDDALQAKLAASKYRDVATITFRNDVRQAQFATIAKLPWLQALSVDASRGIVSLAPIRGFASLRRLTLQATGITDYKPLATLTSLETLSLDGPIISSLAPIGGLTKLQELRLGTLEADVDLSSLATCTSLKTLRLQGDHWQKLEAVTQLETLYLDLSTTSNLDFASKMTKLRELTVGFPSSLETIPALNAPTLEVFSLTGAAQLRDISGLSALVALKTLVLGAPRVESIAALAKLKHLETVEIGHTQVTDLTPLLASASSLKALTVPHGTTAAQLAPLRKANPALKVWIASVD
jgi:Leucine-rich repeat (LRR) protein